MRNFSVVITAEGQADTLEVEAESFTIESGVLAFFDYVKVGSARKQYLKLAFPPGYWAGLKENV